MTDKARKFIGEVVGFILFLLFLLFVSTRGNAQAKKNPFEMPLPKHSAHFRAPIVGRTVSNYMLRHGRLGHLCGRFAITDFSVGNNGRVVTGSPILMQSLKWGKK